MDLPTNVAIGDTGPVWQVGHFEDQANDYATLDSNYTCRLAVIGTAISRAVAVKTADSKFFVAALTAVETAALVRGGLYDVRVQIENLTLVPPMSKEIQFLVFMKNSGI